MEKTILHWLHELPTEYMDKAIKNHLDTPMELSSMLVPTMSEALLKAFNWHETQEGYAYWKALYNELRPNNIVSETLQMPANAMEPFVKSSYGELIAQSHTTVDPLVHKPSHYTQGDIECIDALAAATTGLQGMEAVCTANAIKYLWRWKYKNGVQDLEKAKYYVDKLINELKK